MRLRFRCRLSKGAPPSGPEGQEIQGRAHRCAEALRHPKAAATPKLRHPKTAGLSTALAFARFGRDDRGLVVGRWSCVVGRASLVVGGATRGLSAALAGARFGRDDRRGALASVEMTGRWGGASSCKIVVLHD